MGRNQVTFLKTRKCRDKKRIKYNESPVSMRHAKVNEGFPRRKATDKLKLNTRTSVKASLMKRYKTKQQANIYFVA